MSHSAQSFPPHAYVEEVEEELMIPDITKSFIDLTLDGAPSGPGLLQRNPPLTPHEVCLEKYTYLDHTNTRQRLRPGRVLGRIPPDQCRCASGVPISYVRIQRIVQDLRTRAVRVRGTPFVRNADMAAMLHHARGDREVTCLLEVDANDPRDPFDQAIVEVPLVPGVLSVHVLTVTNLAREEWPRGTLWPSWIVCRWIYQVTHEDDSQAEWALIRLTPAHLNHGALAEPGGEHRRRRRRHQVPAVAAPHTLQRWPELVRDPKRQRDRWRGVPTIPGGTHVPLRSLHVTSAGLRTDSAASPVGGPAAGPTTTTSHRRPRLAQQRYTLFDSFCGAGGVSRGAEMAGFRVSHAVDCWPLACATHRANFPHTDLYEGTVADWVQAQAHGPRVRADVVHLSPPCQFWSPAHTLPGANDEANKAALYACDEVLNQVRPRVFTVEQTFGILHSAHREHFHHLVRSFTDYNYSVRWRVVFLPAWGLPQRRKRLIMIGSCIGEELPTFPPTTHVAPQLLALYPTLRPYTTVRDALSVRIPHDDPLSRVGGRPLSTPQPAWSPDSFLNRCITTHGGQNYHWSGLRQFTAREFALLQGFPATHKFRAADGITAIKKMIGNAFASSMVRVLYKHLARALLRADGLDEGVVQPVGCVPGEVYLDTLTRAVVVPVPLFTVDDEGDGGEERVSRAQRKVVINLDEEEDPTTPPPVIISIPDSPPRPRHEQIPPTPPATPPEPRPAPSATLGSPTITTTLSLSEHGQSDNENIYSPPTPSQPTHSTPPIPPHTTTIPELETALMDDPVQRLWRHESLTQQIASCDCPSSSGVSSSTILCADDPPGRSEERAVFEPSWLARQVLMYQQQMQVPLTVAARENKNESGVGRDQVEDEMDVNMDIDIGSDMDTAIEMMGIDVEGGDTISPEHAQNEEERGPWEEDRRGDVVFIDLT